MKKKIIARVMNLTPNLILKYAPIENIPEIYHLSFVHFLKQILKNNFLCIIKRSI